MSKYPLTNYLRTYRKRAGLTQDDVAHLLGCHTAGQVSRYEHFRREPSLRVALAFEVIFNASARLIFRGDFKQVEQSVTLRAKRMATRLAIHGQVAGKANRLASLRAIGAARADQM